MPLTGYGILYGTVTMARPPRVSQSHWLLMVQPLNASHPPYRVGIELARSHDDKIRIEGQWCDLGRGSARARDTAKRLLRLAGGPDAPGYFTTLQDSITAGRSAAGLDYVRSGIVPLGGFEPSDGRSPTDTNPVVSEFIRRVRPGARVVICGTGYPTPAEVHGSAPSGYTAVRNVHLNQGTREWIRNDDRHRENGADQDGALFVLDAKSVHALFLKYANQSLKTDANGEPLDAGVERIDHALRQHAPLVRAYRKAQAEERVDSAPAALPRTRSAAPGFAFGQPKGKALDDPFLADDDSLVINNPVAQAYATGRTRAPEFIRGGAASLVMNLADVRGRPMSIG